MTPEFVRQIDSITDPLQKEQLYWAEMARTERDCRCVLSFCREYVLELWPTAHQIYQPFNRHLVKGESVAIGVAKRFYDEGNQLDRKQPAIQIVADWRFVSEVSWLCEARLWSDAMRSARAHYRNNFLWEPHYDFRTETGIMDDLAARRAKVQ